MPNARIGAPGWHALRADHFANHGRERRNLFELGKGHRTYAARLMARYALLLEHRRDVLHIGHVAGGDFRTLREVDDASDRLDPGDRDRLAGEHRIQGVLRPGVVRRGLLALVGDLVVDRAPVDNFPGLWIDDDDFSRSGHTQLLTHQLIGVHEDRQVVAVGLRLRDYRFTLV